MVGMDLPCKMDQNGSKWIKYIWSSGFRWIKIVGLAHFSMCHVHACAPLCPLIPLILAARNCSSVKGSSPVLLASGKLFLALLSSSLTLIARLAAAIQYPLLESCAVLDWPRSWPKNCSTAISDRRPSPCFHGANPLGFAQEIATVARAEPCKFHIVWPDMKVEPVGKPSSAEIWIDSILNMSRAKKPARLASHLWAKDRSLCVTGLVQRLTTRLWTVMPLLHQGTWRLDNGPSSWVFVVPTSGRCWLASPQAHPKTANHKASQTSSKITKLY